jgi:hypothetical protein
MFITTLQRHKYRTVFAVAGGGGGFALGAVGGLAAFDDATNSDRKVWTTAVFSAVGGAVGGYFLGRAFDRRTKKTKVVWVPEEIKRSLISSQWGRSPTCKTRVITAKENLSLAETSVDGSSREYPYPFDVVQRECGRHKREHSQSDSSVSLEIP